MLKTLNDTAFSSSILDFLRVDLRKIVRVQILGLCVSEHQLQRRQFKDIVFVRYSTLLKNVPRKKSTNPIYLWKYKLPRLEEFKEFHRLDKNKANPSSFMGENSFWVWKFYGEIRSGSWWKSSFIILRLQAHKFCHFRPSLSSPPKAILHHHHSLQHFLGTKTILYHMCKGYGGPKI